ncbi:hypothetical protein ACFYVL_02405 [Streptomyces sp. NPDC004111]|uniref:hypothetical protein n=1 Tax=Streptomyces sp. NPDC004111 TaxID=3364690 RepID=UPI0036ABC1E8
MPADHRPLAPGRRAPALPAPAGERGARGAAHGAGAPNRWALHRSAPHLKRVIVVLLALAAALITTGVVTGWFWLVGVGVWALIAAFLLEFTFAP